MAPALHDEDLRAFQQGTHRSLYDHLGAHLEEEDGATGTRFAVWAPNARWVSVIGDFNDWNTAAHPLAPRGESGVWEGFLPGVGKGALYQYQVESRLAGYRAAKADPFAFRAQLPPEKASVVWDLDYEWGDADWLARRGSSGALSIYELHLGSWRRVADGTAAGRPLTYREIAPLLVEHVRDLGFTHVELMPVMEHPFYGSWGYQITGYYAATSRYGTPQDLMHLIDVLHQNGIGVILDWVPSHFPTDEHGLGYFDGTHLYEHADPRQGFHPDWRSSIFNLGRNEVRSFLTSNALFWLDRYHADGLRVDAVASILYLDYSRKAGEWIPNRHGGRENLEAISFLRGVNDAIAERFPDALRIAEESTAWPMVSRPTWVGGLGFDLKWDMGWMHDTLEYFAKDPIHRPFHHGKLTFRAMYAFSESFVLPLSHDEVVHGKGSLLTKMAGDEWQRFAHLRLLYAWMFAQPGKKLLFMGAELAPWREWDHDQSLDWHLLEEPEGEAGENRHRGIERWLRSLNRLYRETPALHELDTSPGGFSWIDCDDAPQSVVTLLRQGSQPGAVILAAFNFTPVVRRNYRVGCPAGGRWLEALNSDDPAFGGSGQGNPQGLLAAPLPMHGRSHSLTLTLPPLGALFLRREESPPRAGRPRL
jgi:1,4-alpha-glucan branching enzyme